MENDLIKTRHAAFLKETTRPATLELRDQQSGKLIDVQAIRLIPIANGSTIPMALNGLTLRPRRWDRVIEEPEELGDLD